jgi:N utilization substance protein A
MGEAIKMLANEKNISVDTLLHVLVDALATAYKRRPGAADEVVVEVNPDTYEFTFLAYDVDEDGNWVNERDDTPKKEELGRIAAQTFRQVMSQRIREAERDRKFEEYANREGDIVTGIIQQADDRYTLLDLGRVESLLPKAEQVPFERPVPGDRVKAYIVEVRKTAKGPQIVVSRTHPGLIKRLFELEVPEIADGIVEIKACAREPGHRTKIAVWSNDHNVDPVGACVGARGGRVRMVVNELRGEKIDIVQYSEDSLAFVREALKPATANRVGMRDVERREVEVIVADDQLSLAIGKKGQNVRLAGRLVGWRIEVKSETEKRSEVEEETYSRQRAYELFGRLGAPAAVVDAMVEAGFRALEQLIDADLEDLTLIPGVDVDLALSIHDQAEVVLAQVREEEEEARRLAEELAAAAAPEEGGLDEALSEPGPELEPAPPPPDAAEPGAPRGEE